MDMTGICLNTSRSQLKSKVASSVLVISLFHDTNSRSWKDGDYLETDHKTCVESYLARAKLNQEQFVTNLVDYKTDIITYWVLKYFLILLKYIYNLLTEYFDNSC